MREWLKNRFCRKCQGEGWVWAHELSKWHGEGSPMTDDTKYQCDDACHYDETETEPASLRRDCPWKCAPNDPECLCEPAKTEGQAAPPCPSRRVQERLGSRKQQWLTITK